LNEPKLRTFENGPQRAGRKGHGMMALSAKDCPMPTIYRRFARRRAYGSI
jgi:hypothetical protein